MNDTKSPNKCASNGLKLLKTLNPTSTHSSPRILSRLEKSSTAITIRGISIVQSEDGTNGRTAMGGESDDGIADLLSSEYQTHSKDIDSTMNLIMSFDRTPTILSQTKKDESKDKNVTNGCIRTISSIPTGISNIPSPSSTVDGQRNPPTTIATIYEVHKNSAITTPSSQGSQQQTSLSTRAGGVKRPPLSLTLPSQRELPEASDVATLTPELTPRSGGSSGLPSQHSSKANAFIINNSVPIRADGITGALSDSDISDHHKPLTLQLDSGDLSEHRNVNSYYGAPDTLQRAVNATLKDEFELGIQIPETRNLPTSISNVLVNVSPAEKQKHGKIYSQKRDLTYKSSSPLRISKPTQLNLTNLANAGKYGLANSRHNLNALPTPTYSPLSPSSLCVDAGGSIITSLDSNLAFTFENAEHPKNITLNQLSEQQSPESESIEKELEESKRRNSAVTSLHDPYSLKQVSLQFHVIFVI